LVNLHGSCRALSSCASGMTSDNPSDGCIVHSVCLCLVCVLQGTGERVINASEFFLGYRQVDLQPQEILYQVRVPETFSRWLDDCGLNRGAC
jgi:CO/xanthine dehydrogenase FAD-binding subunit